MENIIESLEMKADPDRSPPIAGERGIETSAQGAITYGTVFSRGPLLRATVGRGTHAGNSVETKSRLPFAYAVPLGISHLT